ncbi:hypothetical protein [Nocardioides sp. Soil805]|uniref:hypothetical protein n=1 Tax=Nocardioides sp. Soil805 TaxID=1736416 RepID=UPI000702A735|nr:hypothetical protein [Nocardioides sp. Soil805]KRF37611.1 hypothetical protein ASG94_10015 [Nocardioides sp. Soil805]
MTRTRRTAALAIGALTAVLLPVGLASPSYASPGCLAEQRPALGAGCDDEVPPETTLTAVSTPANADGWVATSTMSFTFTGQHTDGDQDPIALQCRLTGPAQAHDWTPCTSPRTYGGLADSDQPYAFAVRAVDAADQAIVYSANPLLPLGDDEPGEDLDASPAGLTWRQDTTAPVAFATPDAYDAQTPQRPVVPSRRLPVRLNSSESGVRFECLLDGNGVPCTPGSWVLGDIASGDHSFTARAVDRAGTSSAWTEPFAFSVPTEPARRAGWKKKRSSAAFDGSVLVSRKKGARLVLRTTTVGELRLYAPTAPSYGKVRIRVGSTSWRTVDLGRAKASQREIVVIDQFSGTRRGKVVVEVLSSGRTVKVDAVLARANVRKGG